MSTELENKKRDRAKVKKIVMCTKHELLIFSSPSNLVFSYPRALVDGLVYYKLKQSIWISSRKTIGQVVYHMHSNIIV